MSGARGLVRDLPGRSMSLEEVIERWPVLRQSDLSKFDDCELSAWFNMRYASGLTTHPMARGTIEHRVFAECLREMQRADSESIPVGTALAILEEKLRQKGVPPEDRVRIPLREIPDMRMGVAKWARDNRFTIRKLMYVEHRLQGVVRYRVEDTGELVERIVSGQLDAMILSGADEVTVLDWKGSWGLPPRRDEDHDKPGLSYHGYFQQRFYALLILQTFESINAVTLREFYHRRTEARPARVVRSELPRIEEEMSILVEAFDQAMCAGPPPKLRMDALERHGYWKPQPGKHCFYCAKAHSCPIDDDFKDGGIRTLPDAERAAGVYQQASAVRKRTKELAEGWVDLHGPIPVRNAKGRLVLGHRKIKGGSRFETYVPEGADRTPTEVAFDPNLEAAMRASVEEARKQRKELVV